MGASVDLLEIEYPNVADYVLYCNLDCCTGYFPIPGEYQDTDGDALGNNISEEWGKCKRVSETPSRWDSFKRSKERLFRQFNRVNSERPRCRCIVLVDFDRSSRCFSFFISTRLSSRDKNDNYGW